MKIRYGAEIRTQTQTYEHKHTQAKEMKLNLTAVTWGFDKFRGNDSNWREHNQRLEEDILKVTVNYTLQDDKS